MAVLTKQERTQQIQQHLKALDKLPPDKPFAVELITIGGQECRCPVITFPAEDVLLNPLSHRLRSQLQGDLEWKDLSDDPYSARAQQVIEHYVREARKPEQFQALRDSLIRDGQEQAGVMTHEGVLINANTRAVALRDIENPEKRYITAAVLPDTVRDSELALLELRLQMQKDLKEPYSLTNELLFIEEMSTQFQTPPAQIAEHLRIASGKKGETEVKLRLKLLTFMREMQQIPEEPLRLTFFDEGVKLQHLKDLHAKHEPLFEKDPAAARRLLENWLLSVNVGLTAVHKLRHVDEYFDDEYMLPKFKQDDGLGDFAEVLAKPTDGSGSAAKSPGVSALLGGAATTATASPAGNLLNILTRSDKRIEVTKPGAKNAVQLPKRDVFDAVKAATFDGISAKQGDDRNDNKLEAPLVALKAATASLEKSIVALQKIHDDFEFTKARRDKLVIALKKHRKAVKNVEAGFTGFGIPTT